MSDLFPSLVPGLAAAGQATWRGLRCLGRGFRKLGRVLLLYVLPPLLVIHIAATLITGRLVGKELDRLSAAGHPLTLAEIAPPVPPPGENAADVYQQAFDAYRVSTEEAEEILSGEPSDSPEAMVVAREVVAANEKYFDLLDRASRMPQCVFPVDWEAGAGAVFAHWKYMRDAARMLGVRAKVLNADGRSDEALADCATVFRMARHARTEPSLIAQLFAGELQSTITSAFEETLCSGGLSAEACRDAFDQLRRSAERPSLSRGMETELAFGIWFFDYVRRGPIRDVASLISVSCPAGALLRSEKRGRIALVLYRTVGRPVLNLDQLAHLRAWADFYAATERPWPESGERIETTEASVDALPVWRTPVTKLAFPTFTRAVWTRELRTASVCAAQTALALAAYHGDHGAYPDSLADLEAEGWGLPADPFGGGPYRYRREGDGFVVWSIGPDVDDDNAARDYDAYREQTEADREERERNPYDYDVIFRCSP